MPIVNGRGYSEITEIKQMHFRTILRTQLRIVQAIFKKRGYPLNTFFYFDINCGPGVYEDENGLQQGSPLIFLEEVQQLDLKYSAVFIDIESENIKTLKSHIPKDFSNIHVFCGDHAELLPQFYNGNRQWHYGLLYTDPNGIFNPDLLQTFSQQEQHHATDILINCPAAAIKRVKNSPKCEDCRTLQDRLAIIHKKEWLVRKTLKGSTWQWTFLLGTNWTKFPEFQKIGMVRLNSEEGKSIFDRLNYTAQEWENIIQGDLFKPKFPTYRDYLNSVEFAVIKKQVFQRARGICEQCHEVPATDPHHLVYPDWKNGEIDIPENILAVCHPCHCRLHGKEN